MSEEIKETNTGELTQGDFKVKSKPKNIATNKTDISKVDLSKEKEVENKEENNTIKVEVKKEEEVESKKESSVEIQEVEKVENKEDIKEQDEVKPMEQPVVSEEQKENIYELPEQVKKLVDFMSETGGTLNDYVRLNVDYSNVDEKTLLREFYKVTKPHLNDEEVSFIIEDTFDYDEDIDEERDVRKKQLAFKEEIAKAKNFLSETKAKYYEEIKLRPSISEEQQKAMDFFNRYNEEQNIRKQKMDTFENDARQYFTKDFKGFEFNLGDKKFNYNVKNVDGLIEDQSKLQGLVGRFLSGDEKVDQKNYHKALYAANNIDDIAKHFYEQGKSDATKEIVNKSKNIEAASRPQNNEDLFINGFKVRSISGVDSSKLKIKTRKK